jgi:hypothetical protein
VNFCAGMLLSRLLEFLEIKCTGNRTGGCISRPGAVDRVHRGRDSNRVHLRSARQGAAKNYFRHRLQFLNFQRGAFANCLWVFWVDAIEN